MTSFWARYHAESQERLLARGKAPPAVRARQAPHYTGAQRVWSQDETDRALRLLRMGKSAARVAEQLGRSKNSVLAFAHRAGLVWAEQQNAWVDRPKAEPAVRT